MAVATAQAFTKAGAKATTPVKLDSAVFGVATENHELLKAAYTAYLANGRVNLAVAKTRGLVRGGGRKPWRQKGTGRARFGSSRVPIWRGGGITFGPTGQENYSKQLNTKAKRLAIRQALSLKAKQIIVIEDLASISGKTAELAKLLAKIGATRNTLVVVEPKTPELLRAANNLQNVRVVGAKYLNVYDILNADSVVFTKRALETANNWLGQTKPARPAKEAK